MVLAGRNPPSPGWRSDPGWQTLLRVLPLRNLSPEESRQYLTQRSVPDDQYQAVLSFTHGHPLALSLVAETFAQREVFSFQPEAAPDIIKTLVEQFVQKVPGPAHRAALEACAQVRLMSEPLLSEMLNLPDPHELFDWLRGLSFIESGPLGIFPHDLARKPWSPIYAGAIPTGTKSYIAEHDVLTSIGWAQDGAMSSSDCCSTWSFCIARTPRCGPSSSGPRAAASCPTPCEKPMSQRCWQWSPGMRARTRRV